MANRFYGLNKGQNMPHNVSDAGSNGGEDVSLRVADTVYSDKQAVIIAVRTILLYLEGTETNPIA